jgi:hypothetical protein
MSVKLKRYAPGIYRTLDDRFEINWGEAYTYCENPHPLGRSGKYCPGFEEHAYSVWCLDEDTTGDGRYDRRIDSGDTKRQMVQSLEGLLAGRAREAQQP